MTYQPVTRAEYNRWRGQTRPGTAALRDAQALALVSLTGAGPARRGEIVNDRPVRGGTSISTHAVGRAVDTFPRNKLAGDILFLRQIAAAKACGLGELIWYRKRWTAERGIRRYTGESPHTDHLHSSQTVAAADNPTPHAAQVSFFHRAITA